MRCFLLIKAWIWLGCGLALAHQNDYQEVTVTLNIQKVPTSFMNASDTEFITLEKVYVSLLSVSLIGCEQTHAKKDVSWLAKLSPIQSANANHGIRFDRPAQFPILETIDLLRENKVTLKSKSVPVGKYCRLNLAFGTTRMTKKPAHYQEEPHSTLSIRGYTSTKPSSKTPKFKQSPPFGPFKYDAMYAYGRDIAIDLAIDHSKTPDKISINLDPKIALKLLSAHKSRALNSRDVLIHFPLTAVLRKTTSNL